MKTAGLLFSLLWIAGPLSCSAAPPQFRVSPDTIWAGDRTLLCYEGARPQRATIKPEVIFMQPDQRRPECVQVRPLETTTLRITGVSASGDLFEQNVTVVVKPATHIIQFYAGAGLVNPGESVLVCYGVALAQSVRLVSPRVEELPLSANRCIEEHPKRTTRYTLTATGQGGRVVKESFVIKVAGSAAKP